MKQSPEQYRIFSERFASTEKEEATFNFIKKATNLASNHHPANVIADTMIRMEARKIIMDGHSKTEKTESNLTTIYQPIKSILKTPLYHILGLENINTSINVSCRARLISYQIKSVGGEN